MNKGSMEYKKIMDGLGKIPGLSLPIPGLSKSGYRPVQAETVETLPLPAFPSLEAPSGAAISYQSEDRRFEPVLIKETRAPLSKNDKQIFLQTLKVFYDNHASGRLPLSESKDLFSTLESIAERNRGNQYLHRTLSSLIEAARDFDLARGHLKMVIKNTAEYIKSM